MILFVMIGYVLWMKMFSIYRYIVAVEVLTPLVLMLLLYRLVPDLDIVNYDVRLRDNYDGRADFPIVAHHLTGLHGT